MVMQRSAPGGRGQDKRRFNHKSRFLPRLSNATDFGRFETANFRQRNPKAKAMRLMLLGFADMPVRNLICARARKRKSFEKNGSYRPGAEYTAFPGEDLAVQAICSAQGVPSCAADATPTASALRRLLDEGSEAEAQGGCELAGGDLGVQKTISSFKFLK
jgi:hypothetical protein